MREGKQLSQIAAFKVGQARRLLECGVIGEPARRVRIPRPFRLVDRLVAAIDAFRHPWKLRGVAR